MTDTTHRDFAVLRRVGLVVLALQFAIFSELWIATGFDRASNGFPMIVLATALFVAGQHKLSANPPNRGAARWIYASNVAALAMLSLGALAIGVTRLIPSTRPAPEFVPEALFALMWVIIALKGAAMGKLKPGSAIGLRVFWTRQSRLAWDRAHRTLGRILFWGALIGLATSPVVGPFTTLLMWFGIVAIALTTSLVVSWRTWHLDPERSGGHPA